MAALNQQRADEAERESGLRNKDGISLGNSRSPDLEYEKNAHGQYHGRLVQRSLPVKLKGVDLPKFSGEDKADFEPWRAAFMSVVDVMDIPVGEKVLRLQSSLTGKALALVKDLGYSVNAYERAKEKLEKKYGGERRHNLSLSLAAKEKLSEDDVQAYKHWLMDHSLEDCFDSLIDWVEIRVQIMEEAREETSGFAKRKIDGSLPEGGRNGFRGNRVRGRTFTTTKSKSRSCVVDTCKQNHPPWVCKAFKELLSRLVRHPSSRSPWELGL